MDTGMLWFDNSKTSLQAKVQRAVDYYQKKYGCRPDLCLVSASVISDKAALQGLNVSVRSSRWVLPNHLWIGVEDKS